MKITGSGPTAEPGQRRKVAGRGGESSDASFAEHVNVRPAAGSPVPPTTPLAALSGILATQEVPDPTQERRQATRRGHGPLDELHQLQIGLVEGWCPRARCGAWPGCSTGCAPRSPIRISMLRSTRSSSGLPSSWPS